VVPFQRKAKFSDKDERKLLPTFFFVPLLLYHTKREGLGLGVPAKIIFFRSSSPKGLRTFLARGHNRIRCLNASAFFLLALKRFIQNLCLSRVFIMMHQNN
jgi:hypothetical protein